MREEALSLLHRDPSNRAVAERLNAPRDAACWRLSEDRRKRGVRFERPTDRRLCTHRTFGAPAEWTRCGRGGRPYNVSVARRASVALMDLYVGPKR